MMQETIGPCVQTSLVVQIAQITANGFVACFVAYWAHNRWKRDRAASMRFMDQRIQLEQIRHGVQEANEKLTDAADLDAKSNR